MYTLGLFLKTDRMNKNKMVGLRLRVRQTRTLTRAA